MFSRYFLLLCALVLVATVASASIENETEEDFDDSLESVESRKSFGKKIEKILKKVFKHVNDACLKPAIKKCKKHLLNPSKVISCAKELWKIQNASCLVGAK